MTLETPYHSAPAGIDTRRTITAFFDDGALAQEAADAVRATNLTADVEVIAGDPTVTGTDRPYQEEGFWASLTNIFMPDDDRHAYAEGLRRGGYMVVVQTNDADVGAVTDILERDGTVDLDERTDQWRSTGWTPPSKSTVATTSPSFPTAKSGPASKLVDGSLGGTRSGEMDAEQSLPVAEEHLRVGKREVERGTVRVRSYVTEKPVSEDVRLREEKLSVERRDADRPISGGIDPFKERTIELTQHGEEPVVSKETRITGEVVVSKEETFRTQKVEDTVRRTEVEIEDGRADKIPTTQEDETTRKRV